ncbi:MAG: hypothetical protein AAFN77_13855 [Planctomycetota bacterium]
MNKIWPQRMSQSLQVMSVIGVALLLTGCELHFSSFDGYNFDYTGVTATNDDQGEIPTAVKRVKVNHKFGKVTVKVVDGDQPPSWNWECKVWADDQESADRHAEEVVVEVVANNEEQSWTLLMPESTQSLNGVESSLTLNVSADTQNAIHWTTRNNRMIIRSTFSGSIPTPNSPNPPLRIRPVAPVISNAIKHQRTPNARICCLNLVSVSSRIG